MLYMFNPFDASIMDVVARKLDASYRAQPRPIKIFYFRPLAAESLRRLSWLEETRTSDWFCVFQTKAITS